MTKSRNDQSDSDSGDETGPITKGVAKLSLGELPAIREITVVNSTNFVEKKVRLGKAKEAGGATRVSLEYKYDDGDKLLCLTCPRGEESFFRCNGVEEETYAKKGGQRTGTGKNVMKLQFELDNEDHQKFYDALLAICNLVKKKVDKSGKRKVDVKIRGLYDLVDDDKNVTGHILAARLIESNKEVVYTAAYNDEEQVHIKDIGRCSVRPGITFSYAIPEDEKNYRISVSLAQIYYKTRSIFPLRDVD